MKSLAVPLTAIIGIVILESVALANGIDGAILGISIAAIAGIGGYTLRYVRRNEK